MEPTLITVHDVADMFNVQVDSVRSWLTPNAAQYWGPFAAARIKTDKTWRSANNSRAQFVWDRQDVQELQRQYPNRGN